MITALYTAESGLLSMQTGMDVIAYNIANVNTESFKRNDVTFKNLFSQSYNVPQTNINPLQKGLGVKYADIRKIMKQGSLVETGQDTDLAINGNGFFITKKNGETLYTRLGKFRFDAGATSTTTGQPYFDANGVLKYYGGSPTITTPLKLVNPADGAIVQGWLADTKTGVISESSGITNIEISEPFFYMPAAATTFTTISGSINSNALASTINSNNIKTLTINDVSISNSNINNYIEISGSAKNNATGDYEIQFAKNPQTGVLDGRAVVAFRNKITNELTLKEFPAGTLQVDTTTNTIKAGEYTDLIPGLKLTIKQDITNPVKLTLENTGVIYGEQFTCSNTVYDSAGGQHNLLTTFSKISENTWQWRTDLINVENFKGTGNAVNFAVNQDIDTRYDITITAKNNVTGVTRLINPANYYLFETNKLICQDNITDNEIVTVQYTDKNGVARSETFGVAQRRQVMVLDKNADPDSIEIFVNNSNIALNKDDYQVIGNKILPVDKDGDGIADVPFFYPGADIKVRYKLSSAVKTIETTTKDEFYGAGVAQDFTLTQTVDTNKSITLKAVDIYSGAERALNSTDFTISGNKLLAKDTNNDGIIDSPVIGATEKLVVEYTKIKDTTVFNEQPITLTADTLSAPITLSAKPDISSLIIKVNGVTLSADRYEVSGNKIYAKDYDKNGAPDAFGSIGDKVEISYKFVEETEGLLTFDANGKVIGGNRNPKIDFNIITADKPLSITLNFEDILQMTGANSALYSKFDGNTDGYLSKVEIYRDGTVAAYYTNNETRDIAKIA